MKKYRVGIKTTRYVYRVVEAESRKAAKAQIPELTEMGKLNVDVTEDDYFVEEIKK